ncbi:hypothetical protein KAFR_0G02300 [Kazachstania africana CBS 2517]|uniref:CBS domain-containing protein n=1 Tax=Kazachstania africana (strain ATCC 22294 / BCRC 22015 / CBS 2517 / CECT 1963 / NBRC 1671 / NRRL Y-8276) TaxID=1071382 RepID=H2AY14_KAZAF|nr:hypothetical protein KAFR_0G02300 [Kazachstania africana CBS 2517]CCF59264.1 hypothetical protein KAFR_0G02300 [Kazachstania africana CBS 2517]
MAHNNNNFASSNSSTSSRHTSVVEMLSSPNMHSETHGDDTKLSSVPMDTTPSERINIVHESQWQHIKLSQIIESNKLVFVNSSVSVEEAFNTLMKNRLRSVPVENEPNDMNCVTFDFNDLNAYLLLVLNKITVNNEKVTKDCQNGKPVPVGEIVKLTPKTPFYKLPETDNLSTVMSILGSGVHRVAVTDEKMTKVEGILTQRRLIKYIWDNARIFSDLEPLFNMSLKDLKIGVLNSSSKPTSRQSRVISINGDEPLIMALHKMFVEGISSIAVVDNQYNLIGNISVTDVKHVTRTSQYPLLHKNCRHFISVVLNSRGLETGKDSFPIFHVYPTSSLARTIAKLVATRSHRLWIVQPPESSSTNTIPTATSTSSSIHTPSHSHSPSPLMTAIDDKKLSIPTTPNLFEKEYRTGKLIGVVSLSDIINLFSRKNNHDNHNESMDTDPQSARKQRGSMSH